MLERSKNPWSQAGESHACNGVKTQNCLLMELVKTMGSNVSVFELLFRLVERLEDALGSPLSARIVAGR